MAVKQKGASMLGLMQRQPLTISAVLRHAARHHGGTEIVSKDTDGAIHRTTWAELERRSRRLVCALTSLGIGAHDRVGTLAWNDARHLEIYYAAPGMQAICHTINPRLHPDDIAYIINDAADQIVFADTSFAGLIATIAPNIARSVRAVVMLARPTQMPDIALPPGMRLVCYDDLLAAAEEDYDWPVFDENTASSLC